MKICRILHNNKTHFGQLIESKINIYSEYTELDKLIHNDDFIDSIELSKAVFLPPVKPSKIVCVGRNYAEHAAELGNDVPKEPLLFLKAPSSIITDDEEILLPKQSNQVEHEGELALIIGKKCKNLEETDNSNDYVFGYTCLNDITARDLQRNDVQFTRAKSFDTFCPIGKYIETDLDISDVFVTTKVNNVIKQNGKTSQMVFSIPFLIKYISNQMTLNVGDIIATGTPSGVSKLNARDVVCVEIDGLDTLTNFVTD